MARFNSDVEFDLILSEVEQCYSLKNQLRKKANGIELTLKPSNKGAGGNADQW